jgi:hypothetical protein
VDTHTSRSTQAPAPRLRLTLSGPRLRGGGELHIVGRDEVVTISDPYGVVQHLLLLADGSRTAAELLAALAHDFPQLGELEFRDAIAELVAAGLLEDIAQLGRIRSGGLPRRGGHGRASLGAALVV